MSDIYDQHDSAFRRISAYVIARDGERVATIAFKFPSDGAGRLYAYVHWIGLEMVRGHASGGGYDKRSAACCKASAALIKRRDTPGEYEMIRRDEALQSFIEALSRDASGTWESELRDAGFTIWQAV